MTARHGEAATKKEMHEKRFTKETRSSQRSEYFLIKNSLLCAFSASAVSSPKLSIP